MEVRSSISIASYNKQAMVKTKKMLASYYKQQRSISPALGIRVVVAEKVVSLNCLPWSHDQNAKKKTVPPWRFTGMQRFSIARKITNSARARVRVLVKEVGLNQKVGLTRSFPP